MKITSIVLFLFSLLCVQVFANNPDIQGDIVCKILAENSAECFQMTKEGNIDYSREIGGNGFELALALLEAGGQDEHGMGTTYVSAYDVNCTVNNDSLKCSINE